MSVPRDWSQAGQQPAGGAPYAQPGGNTPPGWPAARTPAGPQWGYQAPHGDPPGGWQRPRPRGELARGAARAAGTCGLVVALLPVALGDRVPALPLFRALAGPAHLFGALSVLPGFVGAVLALLVALLLLIGSVLTLRRKRTGAVLLTCVSVWALSAVPIIVVFELADQQANHVADVVGAVVALAVFGTLLVLSVCCLLRKAGADRAGMAGAGYPAVGYGPPPGR